MMARSIWDIQAELVQADIIDGKNQAVLMAQQGLQDIENNSAALQSNATVNGEIHPFLAVRWKNREIRVTMRAGDNELYIGDTLECFGEKWLVVETHFDECGITRGRAWLCNKLFRWQNKTSKILEEWGIVDDGSYTKSNNQLPTADGQYTIYLPYNDNTKMMYIDKRLALGSEVRGANINGFQEILTCVKITWIDTSTTSRGKGSHLIKLRTDKAEFDAQKDKDGICDYHSASEGGESGGGTTTPTAAGKCVISGNATIRVNTNRNWTVSLVDEDGNPVDSSASTFVWSYNALTGVAFTPNNAQINIKIPSGSAGYALIGEVITLSVVDSAGLYAPAVFEVEVID
jgi:hypothetical protein